MTIRNIYIKIHPFFYIFMLIALFTGRIRDFLIFTSIIIVHECGHILGGVFYKWNIKRIILLPFGGLTIFGININTSLCEQFIVSIMGPIFQVIFFLIMNYFFELSDVVIKYNYVLLFFNLLPIFPLDGSKILNVLFNLFFPFKVSHFLSILISCLVLVFLFFYVNGFIYILMCIFLIISIIKEIVNHKYVFNRFLYERYCNNFVFLKKKVVKSVGGMFLGYGHLFFLDGIYYTERNILSKMFDK